MTRRETATNLTVQKVILDELKAADSAAREAAKVTDFDRVGVREVAEINGEPIGFVQLNKGRETWTISDPAAFLTWVQDWRPDEVVTHSSVRSSYTARVIEDCKKHGGVLDPTTGEVVMPPGVEKREGTPTLQVKPDPDATDKVLAALGDAAVLLGLVERAELLP